MTTTTQSLNLDGVGLVEFTLDDKGQTNLFCCFMVVPVPSQSPPSHNCSPRRTTTVC
jgi:hypothetical protein